MENDEGSGSPEATDSGEGIPLEEIPLHSTNLLTVLDETGVVQYESPSIERIYGFDQEELVGEPVAEYFHPDDRETVVEAFQTVVASEEYTVEAVEYRHERADGSYLWVESVASSNPTPEGHYVVNTRDVSDRKRRERELERTNDRLETFASAVSHDLRSPLDVAAGGLELARADCDSDHLSTVADALDRMEALVEELLTVAREDERALSLAPVSLADLSERCWRTVDQQGASLDVRTDLTVRADQGRLRQLLENLVRNAIEHGGRDVTVTVGALDEKAGFYVADDGPGIPPAERERVFEPGHSSSSGELGLGLAIVDTVVDAHGWSVAVVEGQDGGARFEITGVEVVRD